MYSLCVLDDVTEWKPSLSPEKAKRAVESLESGKVLYFPNLPFLLKEEETEFLSPEVIDAKSKNISYLLKTGRLGGSSLQDTEGLKAFMHRYAKMSRELLDALFPCYKELVIQARTSFRPTEIAGRKSSYRKDDTLLHVDAFPSSPTAGQRILRVFTNINPNGSPRVWRTGEPLEKVIREFSPQVSSPIPGIASLLKLLKVTKSERTSYDHYMLGIHNRMKKNSEYQKFVYREEIAFPPGSSWIVYTDQVSHAALSGQYVLEQTFHLPVESLSDPKKSPLRQLERFLNKQLV